MKPVKIAAKLSRELLGRKEGIDLPISSNSTTDGAIETPAFRATDPSSGQCSWAASKKKH